MRIFERNENPSAAKTIPRVALLGVTLLAGALLAFGAMSSTATGEEEVLARVNGSDITQADVDIAAEMYGEQLGKMSEDARRSTIVDALIEMRVAADAAKSEGIDQDDHYKRQIAFFEGQTLRSAFMEKKLAASVTEEAVRKAYDEQVAKLRPVEEVRIAHILVQTEQEARDIIAGLKSGADFATLARERSKDEASKLKGGDLGFAITGQILPEIEAAAAPLQPGQYSETPVKSAFGFHVIRVDERRKQPVPAYEAVASQIRASLEGASAQKISADLRAKAKIEKLVPDAAPPTEEVGHEQDGDGTPQQ